MNGDFTRMTFLSERHYKYVLMQQGRVQLDAESNEQLEITAHRVETETADTIGPCGTPLDRPGFTLVSTETAITKEAWQRLQPQNGDFLIGPGHYYVDGELCENEDYVLYTKQPDLTNHLVTENGLYQAHLDVWLRHLTALDDEMIREIALGDGDTSTRAKTIWQVKLNKVQDTDNCATVPQLSDTSTGRLSARAKPEEKPMDDCDIPPKAGYRRLENQLYRVEIHTAGDQDHATFKWSRENGSVVVAIAVDPSLVGTDKLKVTSLGRDDVLGLHNGDWVEIQDDAGELAGTPGTLAQIDEIQPGNILKFSHLISGYAHSHPKVRRWESGELKVEIPSTNDGYIPLEDGIQIKFEKGYYNTGDYWLIPARTANTDVEWPRDTNNNSLPQPKRGIYHHFCKLGLIKFESVSKKLEVTEDCRQFFPALTDLILFQYLSGDGQETLPGEQIPQPLKVGVSLGKWPVGKAPLNLMKSFKVRFQASSGGQVAVAQSGAPLASDIFSETVDGVATCVWSPANDPQQPNQQVTATLYNSTNTPTGHLPIIFNASLSIASKVAYKPALDCGALVDTKTVQDAIDMLCRQKSAAGTCTFTALSALGWENVFNEIEEGSDAEICFQVGTYYLKSAVSLQNKGNLKLSGAGKGTRIIVTESESAFIFQNCKSVLIRDMQVTSQFASSHGLGKHLNGVLTFEECGSIMVDDAEFVCSAGVNPSTTCITVSSAVTDQRKPQVPCSVRIRHCDLRIGYQQTGILLVNVIRAHIEDNFLEVRPKPDGMRAPEFLRNSKQYRARIRDTMISRVSYGNNPPPTGSSFNITLTIKQQTIRFMTDPSLVEVWPKLSQNVKNLTIDSPKALLDIITNIANQVLLRNASPSVTALFDPWYKSMLRKSPSVAMSGIIVGGQLAHDIRIVNNTIRGVLRGIHVGVSYGAVNGYAKTSAGTVMIAGNTIGITLPADASALERHGIFAGNCDNLTIENNYVRIRNFTLNNPPVEGIRVYGYLGRKLIVHQNYLVNVTTGIRVQPLPLPLGTTMKSLWLVSENAAPNSSITVQAPASVYKSNNFA